MALNVTYGTSDKPKIVSFPKIISRPRTWLANQFGKIHVLSRNVSNNLNFGQSFANCSRCV